MGPRPLFAQGAGAGNLTDPFSPRSGRGNHSVDSRGNPSGRAAPRDDN